MTEKAYKNGLLITAIIFGIIGLGLAFTPLRMFGLYPAGFALLLLIIDLLVRSKRKYKSKSTGFFLGWILTLVAIALIIILHFAIPKEVAKDTQFEQKIEQADTTNVDEQFQDVGFPEEDVNVDSDSTNN